MKVILYGPCKGFGGGLGFAGWGKGIPI